MYVNKITFWTSSRHITCIIVLFVYLLITSVIDAPKPPGGNAPIPKKLPPNRKSLIVVVKLSFF